MAEGEEALLLNKLLASWAPAPLPARTPDPLDTIRGHEHWATPKTSPTHPSAPAAATAGNDAEAQLNMLLAATNDGVVDWNMVTGKTDYSERWKTLLGYENQELVSSPSLWRELSHPDDLPEVDALMRDHTENLWPLSHTWRLRHKSGEWRWSLCRAITTQDEQGVPLRCLLVFTDVTEQVESERRLSELKRRNELLLTSAGEGFVGIDAGGLITFANPAATLLFGHSKVDLTGRSFSEVVAHGCPAGRSCDATTCPILRPISTGEPQKGTNVAFDRPDGTSVRVDYLSTPAFEQERVAGVVLTFRDVTEQRHMEALHMQGQKLEALGQLAAGIAHEINTPMQYVGDNVFFLETAVADMMTLLGKYRQVMELLKQGSHEVAEAELFESLAQAENIADISYLEESVPKAIASTHDGIGRVRKIVYAMKEFSHPGRVEKSLEDLNHAIDCTTTISAATWKHVATLETVFDPELPKVNCHLGEINQVVLNLIVNAAHAIEDKRRKEPDGPLGSIKIETGVKGEFAEIRISDTGAGIPLEVQHRLFEPFFTTKEVGRGTGQGLTLARTMIVDGHSGYVTFTSEVGVGTTFTVGIPLQPGL